MKSLVEGDADRKPVHVASASTLSNNRAKVTQVLGPCGNFIFPALPSEFRSFMAAAKQLGQDPSELILDAIAVTMEATVAAAAAQNGRAA